MKVLVWLMACVLALSGCGDHDITTSAHAEDDSNPMSLDIVGEWATLSFSEFPVTQDGMAKFNGQDGSIEFFDDGSYSVIDGTVAIVPGCGSIDCEFFYTGSWEIIADSVLAMHDNNDPPEINHYGTVVNVSEDKMTVLYNGTITIMSRKVP